MFFIAGPDIKRHATFTRIGLVARGFGQPRSWSAAAASFGTSGGPRGPGVRAYSEAWSRTQCIRGTRSGPVKGREGSGSRVGDNGVFGSVLGCGNSIAAAAGQPPFVTAVAT